MGALSDIGELGQGRHLRSLVVWWPLMYVVVMVGIGAETECTNRVKTEISACSGIGIVAWGSLVVGCVGLAAIVWTVDSPRSRVACLGLVGAVGVLQSVLGAIVA
jgi:hypothetical protein